ITDALTPFSLRSSSIAAAMSSPPRHHACTSGVWRILTKSGMSERDAGRSRTSAPWRLLTFETLRRVLARATYRVAVPTDEEIDFPSGTPDERELLLRWLAFLRGAVIRKVEG